MRLAGILLAALAVSACATVDATESDPVVQTTSGKLAGSVEGGALVFKGVPYAKPPVGELRWRAPEPIEWDEAAADAAAKAVVQEDDAAKLVAH